MFLTIIPAANADFLPNFFKINCHIGIDAIEETLSKKKREKLNQSSLLNKNMYQSSVIHLHHFFLFTYFKVCQIQSAPWNVVWIKIVTCGVHALLNYIYILVHAILKLRILAGAQLTSKMMMNKEKSSPRSRLWVQNRAKFPWTIFKIMLMMIKIDQTKKKQNKHTRHTICIKLHVCTLPFS